MYYICSKYRSSCFDGDDDGLRLWRQDYYYIHTYYTEKATERTQPPLLVSYKLWCDSDHQSIWDHSSDWRDLLFFLILFFTNPIYLSIFRTTPHTVTQCRVNPNKLCCKVQVDYWEKCSFNKWVLWLVILLWLLVTTLVY